MEIGSPYMVDLRVHVPSKFAYKRRVAATNLQTYREAAAGGEGRSSPGKIDLVPIIP